MPLSLQRVACELMDKHAAVPEAGKGWQPQPKTKQHFLRLYLLVDCFEEPIWMLAADVVGDLPKDRLTYVRMHFIFEHDSAFLSKGSYLVLDRSCLIQIEEELVRFMEGHVVAAVERVLAWSEKVGNVPFSRHYHHYLRP